MQAVEVPFQWVTEEVSAMFVHLWLIPNDAFLVPSLPDAAARRPSCLIDTLGDRGFERPPDGRYKSWNGFAELLPAATRLASSSEERVQRKV